MLYRPQQFTRVAPDRYLLSGARHRSEFEAEYFDGPTGKMRMFRFRLVQFQPDPQDVYRYTP